MTRAKYIYIRWIPTSIIRASRSCIMMSAYMTERAASSPRSSTKVASIAWRAGPRARSRYCSRIALRSASTWLISVYPGGTGGASAASAPSPASPAAGGLGGSSLGRMIASYSSRSVRRHCVADALWFSSSRPFHASVSFAASARRSRRAASLPTARWSKLSSAARSAAKLASASAPTSIGSRAANCSHARR